MRALIRADARALDVHGKPPADVVSRRPRTELLERTVEQLGVVAAVVDDGVSVLPRDPDVIRKLVRLDQVASPHLDPVHAQLGRDDVERPLHDKARMRPACAAVGRGRCRVGIDVAKADSIGRDSIRSRHLRRRDDGQDDPVRRVRAAVVDEVVAQRQHAAVAVETDLDLVDLAALLVDRGEVLLSVLRPLHRAAELHRREWDEQLVRIEQHDLRSEPSSHIGSDDLDARLGKAEQDGKPAADRRGRLGRVVHGQLAFGRRPASPHRAGLHGARRAALVSEVKAFAVRCGSQRRGHVADLLEHVSGDVARHIVVHQVLGYRRILRCDDDRQRLVLDLHELSRVLRDVAALRHYEGDRLACVAHDLGSEAALGPTVCQVGMRDEQR